MPVTRARASRASSVVLRAGSTRRISTAAGQKRATARQQQLAKRSTRKRKRVSSPTPSERRPTAEEEEVVAGSLRATGRNRRRKLPHEEEYEVTVAAVEKRQYGIGLASFMSTNARQFAHAQNNDNEIADGDDEDDDDGHTFEQSVTFDEVHDAASAATAPMSAVFVPNFGRPSEKNKASNQQDSHIQLQKQQLQQIQHTTPASAAPNCDTGGAAHVAAPAAANATAPAATSSQIDLTTDQEERKQAAPAATAAIAGPFALAAGKVSSKKARRASDKKGESKDEVVNVDELQMRRPDSEDILAAGMCTINAAADELRKKKSHTSARRIKLGGYNADGGGKHGLHEDDDQVKEHWKVLFGGPPPPPPDALKESFLGDSASHGATRVLALSTENPSPCVIPVVPKHGVTQHLFSSYVNVYGADKSTPIGNVHQQDSLIRVASLLDAKEPLAERMRPRCLSDIIGQEEVLGESTLLGRALRQMEENEDSQTPQPHTVAAKGGPQQQRCWRVLPSVILWGPPGCGKTTIARLIGQLMGKSSVSQFVAISAALNNLKDVKEIISRAQSYFRLSKRRTVLFVDEIHRFNKLQQDAFLPHVESGIIILVGATTENPSFEVNSALLSRCHVYILRTLDATDIKQLLVRALSDKEHGLGEFSSMVAIPEPCLWFLARNANGDARVAFNLLEMVVQHAVSLIKCNSNTKPGDDISRHQGAASRKKVSLTVKDVQAALQSRGGFHYDKEGDEHFHTISALHKSMRGSDLDASIYWLGRMIEGGDRPLYIARRLIRFASEDVGLADPQALTQCVAAYQACHFLGMPECNLALVQATAYLARAPKSNALYAGYKRVQEVVAKNPTAPVPLHIRNAPTSLMKQNGFGKGYVYPPSATPSAAAAQTYLPDSIAKMAPFYSWISGQ